MNAHLDEHSAAHTSSRPLALVTGASSGIGKELAKQFVDNGFDLLVAAEDVGIAEIARELADSGAIVEAAQVNLSDAAGVEDLYRKLQTLGRPLQAAALNAGVGAGGAFVGETKLQDELGIIDLNVRSTVH